MLYWEETPAIFMLCLICDKGDNKGRYDYGFMSVWWLYVGFVMRVALCLICHEGDNKGSYDYGFNRLGD